MILNLSEDKKFFIIESCTQDEYNQLKIAYTKKAEGYRFNPLFKKKLWDGNITFIKGANIPSGTWSYLIDTAKMCKWKDFKLNGVSKLIDNEITIEKFTEWCNIFFDGLPFTPREYQINAAFNILKYKKCLSELATSAGKTLICFMVLAYLLDNKICKNILMIVPTVQLVLQSSGDFAQYNTSKLPLIIQQAYAGFKNNSDSNITVGTYQTLSRQEPEWYKQFDCVIVDECLHPETKIKMADNTEKEIQYVSAGDKVITYNEEKQINEIKEVEYVYKNLSPHNFLYEITLENGKTIKITGNHKVLLTNGIYKRADELTIDDDILSI